MMAFVITSVYGIDLLLDFLDGVLGDLLLPAFVDSSSGSLSAIFVSSGSLVGVVAVDSGCSVMSSSLITLAMVYCVCVLFLFCCACVYESDN